MKAPGHGLLICVKLEMRTIRKNYRLLPERKHFICKWLAIWLPCDVFHACNLAAWIKIFENSLLCKYSSYRNIYSLMINFNKRRNKGKIMFSYGSKYWSVYFWIRACLQIYAAKEYYKSSTKMFETIHKSGNISPKEIIVVSK